MRDGKCPAEPPVHIGVQTQVDINYSEAPTWVDLSAWDRGTGWRGDTSLSFCCGFTCWFLSVITKSCLLCGTKTIFGFVPGRSLSCSFLHTYAVFLGAAVVTDRQGFAPEGHTVVSRLTT